MQESTSSEAAPLSMAFKRTNKRSHISIQETDEGPARIAVAALESGSFLSENGQDIALQPSKKALVIPMMQNSYRVGGKCHQPSFIPPSSDAPLGGGQGEDRFEMAATTLESTIKEYGLQMMARKGEETTIVHADGITERLKNEREGRTIEEENLPDMSSVEAYEAMPIEEFGMAMLRGMGWKEGMGVGRNRKMVDAIEYLKRPERLGLGAQSVGPSSKPKGPRKMGDAPIDQQVRREDLVLAPDADGRQRHVRKLDEKLVKREDIAPGPRVGKEMVVVEGRHRGLRCTVIGGGGGGGGGGKDRKDRWVVRLKPSEEEAEVWEDELGEQGALQQQRQQRDPPSLLNGSQPPSASSDHQRTKIKEEPHAPPPSSRNNNSLPPPPPSSSSGRETESKPSLIKSCWLYPNIKVRVIDKRINQGRAYLKKGVVIDVHPGARADVRLDETREVLGLTPQDSLETVIPKTKGEALLIVGGKMRGSKGRLLQAKTEEGVAAVQLAPDLSVHQLMLDDVCMFMGSLDEDEE